MNRELWQRISRLENWIRQEGKRTNTCTRQILNEVCEDCRCHRNKSGTTEDGYRHRLGSSAVK